DPSVQSRHSGSGPPGSGSPHHEIDRFLAEVDGLLAAPATLVDRLAPSWPPPTRRRPLFAYGVFAPRAFRNR
ncbi:MAG TPA: hypothetical protein VM263_01780, partial [Acidimicrobiales bacterium]|nr:hypothetical protein [Acidimicrobiales bacterium]